MGMSLTLAGLPSCGGPAAAGLRFSDAGTAIPELMTMKVVGDNKSDFYRLVTTRLKASGVTLADKENIPVADSGWRTQQPAGRLR